ncbi:hypothetical protein HPB48_007860 [Haemaphysalis longicornis]|uniref:Uncharacterized protein n=1 Tax=Haemaphysalis longicornis TaxID=44386 RepID=A0A9J6GUT5_HAELO|nr:hypothetical protein HPB48_007860 [Haemaphysalis longicornis]
MVIGEDARKTYSTFVFEEGEEKSDIAVLKKKFEAFYKPSLNLAYHEYRFGIRDQRDGESFNGLANRTERIGQELRIWRNGRTHATEQNYPWRER